MFIKDRMQKVLRHLGAKDLQITRLLDISEAFPYKDFSEEDIVEWDDIMSKIKVDSRSLLETLGSTEGAIPKHNGLYITLNYVIENPQSIFGITGMPCVGKTSFLRHAEKFPYNDKGRYIIVDEYWNPNFEFSESYIYKQLRIQDSDKSAIVAGCFLVDDIERIHLVTDRRLQNTKMKGGDISRFRIKSWDTVDRIEKLWYDTERFYAKDLVLSQ